MPESTADSIFRVWNKLQEKLSSSAASSRPVLIPQLQQLNSMVYEVRSPLPGERPELEVLLCHGLQLKHGKDTYWRTWMSRDDSHLWLQTWLAELFPRARILLISYDASIKKTDESGRMDMYCTAENLVHDLTGDEVSIGQAGCPIVLVGHCLGGLLLKELCISAAWMLGPNRAETFGGARIHKLFYNLKGMFFYGTPHNGSLLGDGLQSRSDQGELVDDIKVLQDSSARRNEQFAKLKSECNWFTYGLCETQETYLDCLRKRIHVVPEASARSGMDRHYSIDADHYDICRPDVKTSSAITCLTNFLHQIQKVGECEAGAMVESKSSNGYIDLEGRAKQVRSMLASQDTHIVFITGLSGIGKTALAQQVVQGIGHNFQVTCFVSLDCIEEPRNSCKEQVLRKIVEGLDAGNIISRHIVSNVLYYLKEKKVLMVLDNVESREQLDAVRTNIWLEGTASKLIVISTDVRLCTPSNTFTVTYLSREESQQLFCYYAFQGGEGPHDLRHLISKVIHQCENFPLALKILGGYVSTGDVHHGQLWLDLLERLQEAQDVDCGHDDRLWAKLIVCYNVLLPTEKEIFLDVAAVFYGFPFSLVEHIWQASHPSSYVAWSNLKRRFLASVEVGRIGMHSLLRNLGKSIACPGEKSIVEWKRIYSSSSAMELISKHQGVVDTRSLKLQISERESLFLEKSTFLNYVHLKYLILEGVQAASSTMDLPSSLVYLRWTNGLFKVCPVDFTGLENLVVLQLQDCRSMESLSLSIVSATKLKWLQLDGCMSLKKVPTGLSKCLQHLSLEKIAIKELPRDLRKLQGLTHLKVDSPHLTRVPPSLFFLQNLSSLKLRGIKMTSLPESIGNLTGLTHLGLQNTSLISIPNSIGRLKQLGDLDLYASRKLSSLPETLGQLQSLKTLQLLSTGMKGLPQSIGDLANLIILDVGNTPLETLPESVGNLIGLRHLGLQNTSLISIPNSIGQLKQLGDLDLSESRKLILLPETIGQLQRLTSLHLNFTGVKGLPQSIGDLANLRHLDVSGTPLETLPDGICNLHSLELLSLYETQIGTVPNGIGELAKLTKFHMSSNNLKAWPKTFGQLSHLEVLLIDIGPLASKHMSSLYSQEAGGQDQDMALDIQSLLSQLPALQGVSWLTLYGRGLHQSWMQPLFHALQQLPSLCNLYLKEFNLVETIPDELGTLTGLQELVVTRWERLVQLPECMGKLRILRDLSLENNPKLGKLPECLSACLNLSSLYITGCGRVQTMSCYLSHTSSREGKSTMSQVSPQTTLEAVQESILGSDSPDPPDLLALERECTVKVDSWGFARCFLECPWKHFARTTRYHVACKEMEKVIEKAILREGEEYVLDTKVAMELYNGPYFNLSEHHNGLQDTLRPSYHPSSNHCAPHRCFSIRCASTFLPANPCAFEHDEVLVMDLSKESEENSEGHDTTTSDTSEEDSKGHDSAMDDTRDKNNEGHNCTTDDTSEEDNKGPDSATEMERRKQRRDGKRQKF